MRNQDKGACSKISVTLLNMFNSLHPLVPSYPSLLQLDTISHVDSGKSLFNFHPRKYIKA